MANNVVYDAEGNVSRHLQTTPLPESEMLAVPADNEPMAMHVGQEHVPAVPVGVALQTPPTPNPVRAFGLRAPSSSNDDVKHHQRPNMDVQPPRMLTPAQDYGIRDPVPAVVGMELGDDPMLSSFQGTNQDGVLQSLGALSLNDQFVDDKENVVVNSLIKSTEDAGEHTVEEDPMLVPFICGQLDCSKCHPVREVVHESANHKLFFVVHAADAGEFQHAITDHKYIGADGQTILNELMYLDLRQRTHEWVQNFIACTVERLRHDSTGKLEDSWFTFYATVPPLNSNTHMELKMDTPPAKGKELACSQSLAAKQRQKNPMLSMLHMSKKNAAKELNISPTSLDRLCHKSGTISAHRINSLNNKIKKLEQASQRTAAAIVQLKIKKQLDALKFVKARLYAPIKSLLENEKHNDGASTSDSK